jgi:hypothetical protein
VTWGKRLYFPSAGRHAEDFFACVNKHGILLIHVPGSGDPETAFCCVGLTTITAVPVDVTAAEGVNMAPGEGGRSPKIFQYSLRNTTVTVTD